MSHWDLSQREPTVAETAAGLVEQSFQKQIRHRQSVSHPELVVRGEFTSAMIDGMKFNGIEAPGACIYGETNAGGPNSKYTKNEDTVLLQVDGNRIRIGVIDGAGGSSDGRTASALANAVFMNRGRHDSGHLLDDARRVTEVIQKNANGAFATGVVVEMFLDGTVNMVAAGDTKAMTVRRGQKVPEGTTTMHNRVQKLIDHDIIKPWDYYTHPSNNIITNAMGIPENKGQDPFSEYTFQSEPEDIIILGSDGIWDLVSEYEILRLTLQHRGNGLQKALFDLAYQRNNSTVPFVIQYDHSHAVRMEPSPGGGDNITVVVIDKKKPEVAFAIDDFITVEMPNGSIEKNWCITGPVDADNMIPAEKNVNGKRICVKIPAENLPEMNPHGSSRCVTFDDIKTESELFGLLDSIGTITGSKKDYSAGEIKIQYRLIFEALRNEDYDTANQALSTVTNGQDGQNLREAFTRILKK